MGISFIRTGLWLASLALTVGVHQTIPSEPAAAKEEVFLPRPEVARLASLGFDAVLSDYYWIQAIYKVGVTEQRQEEFAPYVAKIIDVVTTLDPWVSHPYRFGAIWLTDSPENVRRGNDFLRRAIEYHPNDWRNYFYLGYNLFYYLGENEAAADALEKAVALGGAPTYLPRLVARLRSQDADLESSVLFLTQLVETSESDEAKAVYQGALDELDVEIKARYLDRAREAFQQVAGRDIEAVTELLDGRYGVLRELPPPEPRDLPVAMRKGDRWFVDPRTGQITSTYYDRRYRVNARARGGAWEAPPPVTVSAERGKETL